MDAETKVLGTLKVSIASHWGTETIYPECELSRSFARLLQQKSFTRRDIERIKGLGFVFEVQTREVKL